MVGENLTCKKCNSSFFLPGELKSGLARIERDQHSQLNELLFFCPKCRPQIFAERTIGKDLQTLTRNWLPPQRRSEPLKVIKFDERTKAEVYKSQCYICNSGCDALVYKKGGRVIRVEGDPSSPITKGTLCCKGLASKEQLYHKDPLLYPMKRIGERGEDKWQRISWDVAMESVAKRFSEIEQNYGPDSIVLATGTKRGTWVDYFYRFANAWGKQFTSRAGLNVASLVTQLG